MKLFWYWAVTIICSYGTYVSLSLKIIKDLADNGYKINSKNINKCNEEINGSNYKNNHFARILIPIINVMEAMDLMIKYNNNRGFLADRFKVLGTLDEMTKAEQEIYRKNPTILTALKLTTKNVDKFTSIKINNGESVVYFRFINNSEDIVVLKTVGPAKVLNEDKILEEVKKELGKLSYKEKALIIIKNDAETVDLDAIDENSSNLTSREKIEVLEKTKSELLKSNNPQEKNIQSKSLKKTRKQFK